jgi:hypothetical protein
MRTHIFKKREVCPANWEAGKEAMSADDSTAEYLSLNCNNDLSNNQFQYYKCFIAIEF